MATPINILKEYFETGKKPTQQQFYELLEAFVHRDDDLQALLGVIAEVPEAEAGNVTDKYMTPFLTKKAINALTRLANIPDLNQEVVNLIAAASSAANAALNSHTTNTSNPHGTTKAQVGLGNLPNAKSDSTTLNDSNTLATSKSVKDLNDAKEPAFSKNTGFNKNFGTTAGTVSEGNHTHTSLFFSTNAKITAISNGVSITGGASAQDFWASGSLGVRPNGAAPRQTLLYRGVSDESFTIRVDTITGAPNWSAAFQFKENGDLLFSSASNRIREASTGTIIGSTSDVRLKRNVENISEELDKVIQLRPVKYLFHSKEDAGKSIPDRLGFIAQEVEALFPEIIDISERGFKSIDYNKLTVVLVAAIKELTARIEVLENP